MRNFLDSILQVRCASRTLAIFTMNANPGAEETRAIAFNINAAIHAPFNGLDESDLYNKVIEFVKHAGLDDYKTYFLKAGFIAQNDEAFKCDPDDRPFQLSLSPEEERCLDEEKTRRWKHPGALWRLVALCALGAVVQGWDEAAVDGGMLFQKRNELTKVYR